MSRLQDITTFTDTEINDLDYFWVNEIETSTATLSIASPCVVTKNSHGLEVGNKISFTTTGALPTGLVAGTNYFIISSGFGVNSFKLSATFGGTAINTSGTQSGVHTYTAYVSKKITGEKIKTLVVPSTPASEVSFDKLTPTTAGVVFTPNTPATTNILYYSTIDGSTWIYNGTIYKSKAIPNSTEFNIDGVFVDAGSNKTSSISRNGSVMVRENNTLLSKFTQILSYGVSIVSDTFAQISSTTVSSTLYPLTRMTRKRGTITSQTNALSGDTLGMMAWNGGSANDSALIFAQATENNAGTVGSSLYFQTVQTGSSGLSTAFWIDGTAKLNISLGSVYTYATANTLSGFDASKNLVSLSVATYPSLTELSYVKGVASNVQNQINNKVNLNTLITPSTGTKITYDAKGLVLSSTNITTSDVSGLGTLATQSGTFSGTSSGTNTGDQIISDATITTTDITTNNFTTAKHGFVPKGTNVGNFLKDDGTWGTPASGGSSGIVGIANSSGVYTYYATLTLAMAAAVSGNTIELFADITETGSVAITLKSGVKINGNGHTYTLSVNDNTHALICSVTVDLFNWKVVRTGRANGSGGLVLSCAGGTLRAQGVIMQNTYGTAVIDGAAIYGLNAIGYYSGISFQFENTKLYECIGESTGLGSGIESTYTVNCTGIAISGAGITGNGTHLNSTGISTSGSGLTGQTFTGCIGISTSGTGVEATAQGRNCIGISTSGIGGTGIFYESTLISSSNYGCQATIYNSYTHSVSSVATSNSNIYNSTVRCLWDNAAGHCTATFSLGSRDILNSFLEVTNASAYCINGYFGSTWKYAGNVCKGSTTAVNSTNITQGITNTSDNQGNILI